MSGAAKQGSAELILASFHILTILTIVTKGNIDRNFVMVYNVTTLKIGLVRSDLGR